MELPKSNPTDYPISRNVICGCRGRLLAQPDCARRGRRRGADHRDSSARCAPTPTTSQCLRSTVHNGPRFSPCRRVHAAGHEGTFHPESAAIVAASEAAVALLGISVGTIRGTTVSSLLISGHGHIAPGSISECVWASAKVRQKQQRTRRGQSVDGVGADWTLAPFAQSR